MLFYWSAYTAGAIVARLTDPVGIALLIICLALGFRRIGLWTAGVGAALATAITFAAVYSWWIETGVADHLPGRLAWLFYTFVLIALPAYGIGSLARSVVHRTSQKV